MPSPPIHLRFDKDKVKKIPFTSYDLASDEAAKRLWKRKAPIGYLSHFDVSSSAQKLLDKQQLPGILIGGKFPGVRCSLLHLPNYEHIAPPVQPIGVPGAAMPLDMTPERLRDKVKVQPTSSTLADKSPYPSISEKVNLISEDELSGFGLQGLKITGDELRDLIAELGMDGDDAGDLLKGLGGEAEAEKEAEADEREASPSPEENRRRRKMRKPRNKRYESLNGINVL
ncbi:hypothetical protein BDZ89DRAFT_1250330 [Hymenopellis radicata]|nr:hypothetical protein BDZ89DRAFT_1250330 [Hymenopellis radicata]